MMTNIDDEIKKSIDKRQEVLKKVRDLYSDYEKIIEIINSGDPCEEGLENRAFEQGMVAAYKNILPLADDKMVIFIANEIEDKIKIVEAWKAEQAQKQEESEEEA